MNCPMKMQYIIKQGDNLYQLSRYYQTTVPAILALNPDIDPYNLQIGRSIIICPGDRFVTNPYNPNPPVCPNPAMQRNLYSNMLLVWLQHVYWTRLLIISISNKLNDESDTAARLLQNPSDTAKVFANYYSPATTHAIEQLLTEHLQLAGELITALRDGQKAEAEAINKRWYQNADQMAEAFGNMNPFYNTEDVRNMLYEHLSLTTLEVEAQLANNYKESIETFNKVEQSIIKMANYFSSGIVRQFPQNFM